MQQSGKTAAGPHLHMQNSVNIRDKDAPCDVGRCQTHLWVAVIDLALESEKARSGPEGRDHPAIINDASLFH